MGAHPYTVLDVFTATPLEGNALAVIHDADVLDADTMLRVARKTRLSETSFVQTATEDGVDYRHRIFMPTGEIPFAGHPSLGTAVAVARARGESRARYVQQTGSGLQAIDVRANGDRAKASMLQEPAEFGEELDPAAVLPVAGLSPADADPDLPPQLVYTGARQIVVPLRDASALERITPGDPGVDALIEEWQSLTVYYAWVDRATGEGQARALLRRAGGVEDPATGSAVGPLCAYLAARGGPERISIVQGVQMGRPSRLEAEIEGDRVRVAGEVVTIVDGTLRI